MIDGTVRGLFLWLAISASVISPPAVAAAPAPPTTVAAGLAQAALSDSWGYGFLESLTTEVGQRLAGTDAEARAAQLAAAKLKAAGMEVHLETFPITAWERGVETAAIVKPAPQRLILTALGGSVATPAAGIEGEAVVFRTYAALLAAAPGRQAGGGPLGARVRAPPTRFAGPAHQRPRGGARWPIFTARLARTIIAWPIRALSIMPRGLRGFRRRRLQIRMPTNWSGWPRWVP
jgi:hypothetical protein